GPGERVEVVLNAKQRGRVDRFAGEKTLNQLSAFRHAEELRQRPGGAMRPQPLRGARRQDQHAVLSLAAKRLLPGEGDDIELVEGQRLREGRAGGVADSPTLAVGSASIDVVAQYSIE